MEGMNKRFHELVDKKLLNTISKKEETELSEIEDYYDFMDIEETKKLQLKIEKLEGILERLKILQRKLNSK